MTQLFTLMLLLLGCGSVPQFKDDVGDVAGECVCVCGDVFLVSFSSLSVYCVHRRIVHCLLNIPVLSSRHKVCSCLCECSLLFFLSLRYNRFSEFAKKPRTCHNHQ